MALFRVWFGAMSLLHILALIGLVGMSTKVHAVSNYTLRVPVVLERVAGGENYEVECRLSHVFRPDNPVTGLISRQVSGRYQFSAEQLTPNPDGTVQATAIVVVPAPTQSYRARSYSCTLSRTVGPEGTGRQSSEELKRRGAAGTVTEVRGRFNYDDNDIISSVEPIQFDQ